MSDTLPTVWDAEPHTLAKHAILKSYFEAWAAILSNAKQIAAKELLFVDGFAGPGEYKAGELGSPLVVINAVLDHTRTLPKPVRFVLIENRVDRYQRLCARIAAEQTRIDASPNIIVETPILGDCDTEVRKLIAEREARHQALGPALFFLDQFGYSQVPMTLLHEIMRHETCEAFSYLNCQRMNTFLSDETKWEGITAAYGDETWKAALPKEGHDRQQCLIDTYTDAIRRRAGADYVWPFAMFDGDSHLIYWLVFSTNNLSGLEQMKKAMWRADRTGTYRFSDRVDASQQTFFNFMDNDQVHADVFADRLSGKTMSEHEMKVFVLTSTPFHKFKKAVKLLRKQGKAIPVRSGNDWPVRFH